MKIRKSVLKQTVVLLAALVLIVVMYSSVFFATHQFHSCTGGVCSVCYELQRVKGIPKSFVTAVGASVPGIVRFVAFCIGIANFRCLAADRTLVSEKIRMDR